MSDPKKRPRPGPGDDLLEVDELPPMDDDRVEEADPEELADYLSDFEEAPAGDGEDELRDEQGRLAEELVEIEEGSWIDDGQEAPAGQIPAGAEAQDRRAESPWQDYGVVARRRAQAPLPAHRFQAAKRQRTRHRDCHRVRSQSFLPHRSRRVSR